MYIVLISIYSEITYDTYNKKFSKDASQNICI